MLKGKGFLEEGDINFVRRTRGLSTPKQKKGRALEMRWGTSLRGGRRELLLGYFFEPRGFRVGVPYWLKGRGLLWRGGSFSAAGPWAPNLKAEEGGWVGKGADGALKYGGEGGMLEDWGKVSIKGRRGGASSI